MVRSGAVCTRRGSRVRWPRCVATPVMWRARGTAAQAVSRLAAVAAPLRAGGWASGSESVEHVTPDYVTLFAFIWGRTENLAGKENVLRVE